jgi:hypothetical protein
VETISADLLKLEEVLVELLLEALVSVVDAELLKGVLRKGLESVDVKDRDDLAAQALLRSQALVDAVHDVGKD